MTVSEELALLDAWLNRCEKAKATVLYDHVNPPSWVRFHRLERLCDLADGHLPPLPPRGPHTRALYDWMEDGE